ncbi:MAG: class I SAM-dependent methyltransferase [Sinimarinibacterium sp.]|jgi:SAM-dependent methyltransferase
MRRLYPTSGENSVTPSDYARWRASRLGAAIERLETRLIFDLASPLAGKRVLDVGTGDGTYAIGAAARSARVTALDLDRGMLAAAKARADELGLELTLRRGRAERLPFGDASFDVVLAVTVLCFVPDAQAVLREMARVLAPGGRLVLGELNRWSLWAARRRVRGWLGNRTWRSARFRSRWTLACLAGGAGLRVGRTRGAVFLPPWGAAAPVLAPLDHLLTRLHAPGGAFLALAADKPLNGHRR